MGCRVACALCSCDSAPSLLTAGCLLPAACHPSVPAPPAALTANVARPATPQRMPALLPPAAGMPNSKTGVKGNLRLRFDIQFPRKQLSEEERGQLEAMLKDKY